MTRKHFAGLLAAVCTLAGCASGGGTTAAPAASAPGGARPKETSFSKAASTQIGLAQIRAGDATARRAAFTQALSQAQLGVQGDPSNAIHFYLAGQAHAGLGNYAAADSAFDRAQQLFPGYAAEIEPERERAWAVLFNEGVTAYNAGNLAAARTAWEQANAIYDRRPEAYQNLAAVYAQERAYDRAVAANRGALAAIERATTGAQDTASANARRQTLENLGALLVATEQFPAAESVYVAYLRDVPTDVAAQSSLAAVLAKQNRRAEANQIYTRLLGQPNLTFDDYFSIGVGLFNANERGRAAEAFQRAAALNANSRDAFYNLANALYDQKRWQEVIPVTERLLQLDPGNENAYYILATAMRESKQPSARVLQVLERRQNLPVFVEEIQLRRTENRSTVAGTVKGNKVRAGAPVRMRFTFFGPAGELGSETVTVQAPAAEASRTFEVSVASPVAATGYRYEILP